MLQKCQEMCGFNMTYYERAKIKLLQEKVEGSVARKSLGVSQAVQGESKRSRVVPGVFLSSMMEKVSRLKDLVGHVGDAKLQKEGEELLKKQINVRDRIRDLNK